MVYLLKFIKLFILMPIFLFFITIPISINYAMFILYASKFFFIEPLGDDWVRYPFMLAIFIQVVAFPIVIACSFGVLLVLKILNKFNKKNVIFFSFSISALFAIIHINGFSELINPFYYLTMFNGWAAGHLFWKFWKCDRWA